MEQLVLHRLDRVTTAVMALSNGDVATVEQLAARSGASIESALAKLEELVLADVAEKCVECKGKYTFWRLREQYLAPLEPLFEEVE